MSTVNIAPHLQRALEAMSKDMAVDPQALVNQAVFAWLRINGYVTPGVPAHAPPVVAAVQPVVAPPPVIEELPTAVEASAPEPEPVAEVAAPPEPEPEPQPEPEAEPEAPAVEAAAPVAEEAPAPEAEGAAPAEDAAPTVDVRLRMKDIDDDLARLTKPWPAWTNEVPEASDEEEEEDDEDDDEQEEAPEQDDADRALDEAHRELSGEAEVPAEEDEAIDTDRHRAAAAVDEPTGTGQSLEEEEPLDGNTGETEVEAPHESTVVLRSNPISLYLERDGHEPVRITVDRFIIGRGPQCDLIIDSPRVSREHAALKREGVTWHLEDLGSSNGTWFNGESIKHRELESGDTINLGNEPVTFVLRAE